MWKPVRHLKGGEVIATITLVCKGCHKVMDYKFPVSIDSKEVAKRAKFWITDTKLEYHGYCGKCRKELQRKDSSR
jgi:Fe2+ or Zn2+ uptake regulation protein